MHDEATLRDALQRLIDAVWQRPNRAAFTIPADVKRDADLILSDAIDELVRLRAALAAERVLASALGQSLGAFLAETLIGNAASGEAIADAMDRYRTAREDERKQASGE